MKIRFCLILLLVGCWIGINGKNISKKYLSYESVAGTVFFIKPQTLPRAERTSSYEDLEYDITIIPAQDSVHFTMTVYSQDPKLGSRIQIGNNSYLSQMVFADLYKSMYRHRLKFSLSLPEMYELYESPTPYVLQIDNRFSFSWTPKAWRAHQSEMNQILQLIKQNYAVSLQNDIKSSR